MKSHRTELPPDLTMLIDGDWLLHMACMSVEYNWPENEAYEEGNSPPFEWVVDVLENKINEWKATLQTEAAPLICFSGGDNFRKTLAVTKTYKGNRDEGKPFHYSNLKAYVEATKPTLEHPLLEADDLMAIEQTSSGDTTIIVTVDKDLRQVNGWLYSPEGHNYPSLGPVYISDENSYIELDEKNKLRGIGYKFFWSQVITGDGVDNIPGLPRRGPKFAYELLDSCTSDRECYLNVRDAYRNDVLCADDFLEEQINLLWMVREMKMEVPIRWNETSLI